MKLPKVGKKTILVGSVIVLGLTGGAMAQVSNNAKVGADTSPLVAEVDKHSAKLNNHEARISNAENNIRALQSNTGTRAAPGQVSVPVADASPSNTNVVDTPSSGSNTPTADPVVVTAFREIVIDPDTSDCEYTYSDGSTYVFHWKTTVDQQVGFQPGGSGPIQYKTQKSKVTNGYCDTRAIGLSK